MSPLKSSFNYSFGEGDETPRIVTNGLVLNLDAGRQNSYNGGTTWRDLSGSGNNGTLYNGPTYSNANRGYITIDGNDDYVLIDTTNFPSGNSPFTMECFINWSGNGVNNIDVIFGYGYDVIGGNKCPLFAVESTNVFTSSFGSNTGIVTSTSTVNIGTWYHACLTYNSSQLSIYVNGRLESTLNYTSANTVLNNNVNGNYAAIGALISPNGTIVASPRRYGTFNGKISVMRMYNRALSAAEIQQNFNATRGRYGI